MNKNQYFNRKYQICFLEALQLYEINFKPWNNLRVVHKMLTDNDWINQDTFPYKKKGTFLA
jgi:hypothetical protein